MMSAILGELIAGIVFGTTGFDVLHPSDPIFAFLTDMGFALVMFVAGTHVPVRDPAVHTALGNGAVRAVLVGLLAIAAGCPLRMLSAGLRKARNPRRGAGFCFVGS